jgi:hypothetical protein
LTGAPLCKTRFVEDFEIGFHVSHSGLAFECPAAETLRCEMACQS